MRALSRRSHPTSTPRLRRAVRTAVAVAAVGVVGAVGLADTGRHTIRPGETLGAIARQHGTTASALAGANGLADPNRIVAGRVLVIPGAAGAAAAAPAAAAATHTIAPGESLQAIARRYGTSVTALAQANGLTDPDRIVAGRTLTVPGGGGGGGGGAGAGGSHRVSSGETLGTIARRYGTTVNAIAAANGLSNPNLIRAGANLSIPTGGGGGGGGGAPAPSGSDGRTGVAGTHTVRAGESLAAIARRYGVSTAALAAANGIPQPFDVYTGARLNLSAPNRLPTALAACPVRGATFMNDWGFPRSGGRAHAGNDLFAPRGTAVRAPVAGNVSYATGSIGGRQFRLTGDDGNVYIGSHMDSFGPAGRVSAGSTVGTVGDTGNARGGTPHLHFEIHPGNGAAMNPYSVLRAVC